jgi:hypothetical protein
MSERWTFLSKENIYSISSSRVGSQRPINAKWGLIFYSSQITHLQGKNNPD